MRRWASINNSRRANWVTFLAVAAVYFLLFVPPNLTGARNPNMLAVFSVEEFTQYLYLTPMTSPSSGLREAIHNLVFYGHYYYGYPFYLLSASAVVPGKLLLTVRESFQAQSTTLDLAILRQLSSLFILAAVGLLTYCWTEFRDLFRTLLLTVVLLTVPGAVMQNMWWHAEAMSLFFVALTIFALWRDNLRFGPWFYGAAVACGLAAGIKLVGLWFFLAVAVYLLLGLRKHAMRVVVRQGVVFALIMSATIIITNPLLLVASTRQAMFDTLGRQADRMSFGWDVRMTKGPLAWYDETLRDGFGHWWFFGLAFTAAVFGIVAGKDKRLLSIIILAFTLPFAGYLLFFVAAKAPRYFLPVAIPLFSCLGNPALFRFERRRPGATLAGVFLLVAIAVQIVLFVAADRRLYTDTLRREATSPALAFYRQLDELFLSSVAEEHRLVIYHDIGMYVPPDARFDGRFTWRPMNYDTVRAIDPHLLLVRRASIERYADPEIVGAAYDQQEAHLAHLFARDAEANDLDGYRRILATEYGSAYLRTD